MLKLSITHSNFCISVKKGPDWFHWRFSSQDSLYRGSPSQIEVDVFLLEERETSHSLHYTGWVSLFPCESVGVQVPPVCHVILWGLGFRERCLYSYCSFCECHLFDVLHCVLKSCDNRNSAYPWHSSKPCLPVWFRCVPRSLNLWK